MKRTIYLWKKEEYHYPCAGDFLPNITAYLQEDGKEHPAMIVVPGGGYSLVSPTEGELVARRFMEEGYQTFVLTYTTDMFQLAPLGRQPLKDISRAVRYVRKNAQNLNVIPEQIACCGFSAGAHLVGSLAVHYKDKSLADEPDQEVSNRPDATLLCYPVITGEDEANRPYIELLSGKDNLQEEMEWSSLEKHVTSDTPPAFLWHTLGDELVSPDNSILYTQACRKAEVPCELHLFMGGRHGMSLADEKWASNQTGVEGLYTMMQQWQTLKTLYAQSPEEVPEGLAKAAKAENLVGFVTEWGNFMAGFQPQEEQKADISISQWISLALAWVKKIYNV